MDVVDAITSECFNAALQLRAMDEDHASTPDLLHGQLRRYVDGLRAKAKRAGLSTPEIDDVSYAVVALLDEIAVGRAGPIRDYWLGNLLQMHYFNENTAGDGFFQRLERLQPMADDPRGRSVLRVYHLVLMFGFHGRYRVRGGEAELSRIRSALAESLFPTQRSIELAPTGAPPRESRARVRKSLPLVAFSIAVLVAAVASYGILVVLLDGETQQTIDRIKEVEDMAKKRGKATEEIGKDEKAAAPAAILLDAPTPEPTPTPSVVELEEEPVLTTILLPRPGDSLRREPPALPDLDSPELLAPFEEDPAEEEAP